jgi:hypothetical protein
MERSCSTINSFSECYQVKLLQCTILDLDLVNGSLLWFLALLCLIVIVPLQHSDASDSDASENLLILPQSLGGSLRQRLTTQQKSEHGMK